MKEKILFYLNALNTREKALLIVLVLLLGTFLGTKVGQSVLQSFFDYDLSALYEEKQLVQNQKTLFATTKEQKRQIAEFDALLTHFSASEKGYLDELYALAGAQNLTFASIKNSTEQDKNFAIHSIFIEFQSDFYQCLSFLQGIQKSPLFFEFSEINFDKNDENKTLQTSLHLRFVVVK